MGPDPSRPTPKNRAVAEGFFATPSPTSGRSTATFRERGKRETRHKLQSAIAALGDRSPLVRPLKEALKAAQARSKVQPVADRVESCKLFIARGQRRVTGAEEVIKRAQEQRAVHVVEVEEAQQRLEEEAAASIPSRGAGGGGIAETDRRIGQGTRPLASGVPRGSTQRWPRRMVRRQHPQFDRGASLAFRSTRFGAIGTARCATLSSSEMLHRLRRSAHCEAKKQHCWHL